MQEVLKNLEPARLWEIFEDLTKIARPSGGEEKVRDYVRAWAEGRGFNCAQDEVGNLIVDVPATAGRHDRPTLVLQVHGDMICERDQDATDDPAEGRITLRRDGDWLLATKTTLGADNGIGLATAMALAEDQGAEHGRWEILVTVDEESGLKGVKQLNANLLSGRLMLNLDSEEQGEVTVSSAGGEDVKILLPTRRYLVSSSAHGFEARVRGLRGGHSGTDIHLGHLNTIQVLAGLLNQLEVPFRLVNISGGQARNGIPREASARVVVGRDGHNEFSRQWSQACHDLGRLYEDREKNLAFSLDEAKPVSAFSSEDSQRIISTLLWQLPVDSSHVLRLVKEAHLKQVGTPIKVVALHAGLECGTLASRMPDLDVVSLGPTIRFPHSPDERVLIRTVPAFYQLVREIATQV
ncbi:MAG: M20/M25/M40 family metallo-hydrolase [Candidatus Komeilibacteria bacterium]|nr:M20/M25/M40 family metallo-hydrolase [Candidatus Komeilibacteria bacterium]